MKKPNESKIDKLLKSLQEKIPSSDRQSGDAYISKLELILKEFHSQGFDSERIAGSMLKAAKHEYIGLACEISAAYSFMRAFPKGFIYQVESGVARSGLNGDKRKSFDFAFEVEGVKFSVEVKTFKASSPPPVSVPIKLYLQEEQTKELFKMGLKFTRNCMPPLGRFLRDANNQLSRNDDSVGVVLICCNDIDEFSDAISCFISEPSGILYRENQVK